MEDSKAEPLRFFLRNAEGLQEHHIQDYFSRFGSVSDVSLVRDKKTKRPRGLAFVTVQPRPGANITDCDSHTINNIEIEVEEALPQRKPEPEVEQAESKEPSAEPEGADAPIAVAADEPPAVDHKAEKLAMAQWQMHYLAMAINASIPDAPSIPQYGAIPKAASGVRSGPY
mmetsp:Transcript_31256/g.71363  ORF Transcript_31256/g.71363 Transcript_31256/m.71363 type:complete len:171 (+) Transcript_31256:53-565(+)|eukprot:3953818-Amphidinium_carterae.1